MAKSTRCSICQKRPVGSGQGSDPQHAKSMGYCAPCLEEGEWENTHNDYGHDEDYVDHPEMGPEMEQCWICHPELNRASDDYAERAGTSRAGMVIHVSLRATGAWKAAEVAEQMPNFAPRIIKPSKRNGGVTKLVLDNAGENSFEVRWDHRGRFIYGILNGRKVRNVAELLRKLA